MHKYLHHIGDFIRDTSHLTPVEECFYRRAIDWYYLNEKPFPNDMKEVCRLLRAKGKIQTAAVETVFKDFFYVEENFFKNSRCEKEITAYHNKNKLNRVNGKLGGRPKKNNSLENHDGFSEDDSGLSEETREKGNHNHKPITDNHINNIDSNNNAPEEKLNFVPINFVQYQGGDHQRYTFMECVNTYPLQYDFYYLALERYPDIPDQDLVTMLKNYGDFYANKGDESKNTPGIWLQKWFTWIQNNHSDVKRKREAANRPASEKPKSAGYQSRTARQAQEWMEELNQTEEPVMRDVHAVEGVGHA